MQQRSYVDLAKEALLELLDSEHAVVWPEVEARLSEQPWRDLRQGLNPHILLPARRQLLDAGRIERLAAEPAEDESSKCSLGPIAASEPSRMQPTS